MVTIEYDRKFKKHFRKRIYPRKKLLQKYQERLELFTQNRRYPKLEDHKLIGSLKGLRSFSITGNIRVVYIEVANNHFVFLNVGTHGQIYG